jgi:glycosyltransferase involved in cell wall biosynthesis
MRVAFIHNLTAGGAHRTMAEHARRLSAETSELCLQTADPFSPQATILPLRLIAPSLPPALRPPFRYRDLGATVRSWQRLAARVAQSDADVVVVHPCRYLQCPPAVPRVRAPTVYFCHEPRRVDHEPAAMATRNHRTARLYARLYAAERRLDAAAVACATVLITNSHFSAAAIQTAYGREALVIRMGVADVFAPGQVPRPGAHVLSVGSLIASKGHDLAIQTAARASTRAPVVIVAPRHDREEEARLRDLARVRGVQLRIAVAISDLELRDLYREALATLYLARAEPLGLAALEAQACGCPVIVSAEGGLPETVRDGRSGWAVPRDAGAAAAKLDLLAQGEVRRAAGAHAAAHGAGFSWAASARDLQDILEGLVSA